MLINVPVNIFGLLWNFNCIFCLGNCFIKILFFLMNLNWKLRHNIVEVNRVINFILDQGSDLCFNWIFNCNKV